MRVPFRRTFLASSLLLCVSAYAAPAGNLTLMPWPDIKL